jgi:DNA gyrase subunit A
LKRGNSARAINLDDDDLIISVFFGDDNTDCGIMSTDGNFIMIKTDDMRAIGRISRGVKCMKLNPGAYVKCARAIPADTETIVSVTAKGLAKQSPISDFSYTNKGTKGSKIQGLTTDDTVVSFTALRAQDEVIVTSNVSQIRLSAAEIPLSSRAAQGVKTIKLKPLEQVVTIEKI